MNTKLSLKQLALDVWLLEELRNEPLSGLSLGELQVRWQSNPRHQGTLSRSTLTRHRKIIETFFGVKILCADGKFYKIANPEQLALDSLANDLLASLQEYMFLDEYRDLGDAIQPSQIWGGLSYLHDIGDALRNHKKLEIQYQKFSDDQPYSAILHPYCLKADKGRWYLLAHKEGSDRHVQTFALDRMPHLHYTDETFEPFEDIDPATYFKDCFGIWHDFEHYPVRDITIATSQYVAKYLRTLSLHDSQREVKGEIEDDKVHFSYHISPTPDFMAELSKWGDEIEIIEDELQTKIQYIHENI